MQLLASLIVAALALASSASASKPPPTDPLAWPPISPCAIDTGSRIIANDITTNYADNTPASCIARCAAAGSTYAGVEYGKECHCGTGLKDTPTSAPLSECDMPCSGDPNLTCGGSLRIQIYRSPALPAGGTWAAEKCYYLQEIYPVFSQPFISHTLPKKHDDPVGQCTDYCRMAGYPLAGVKGKSHCLCGETVSSEAVPLYNSGLCANFDGVQVYHYQY